MTVEKIPAWPDPTSPEGKNFFANAKAILAAWEAKGASNPLAFAMLAQAEAESSFDPNAKGDHNPNGEPTAFGLHQWHHPRLTTISVRPGSTSRLTCFPARARSRARSTPPGGS